MHEKHHEHLLDQSLADTFPASDPVSLVQPGGGGADTLAMQRTAWASGPPKASTAERTVDRFDQ